MPESPDEPARAARRRPYARASVAVILLVAVGAAGWLALRGLQARTALAGATGRLEVLQEQVTRDGAGARATLAGLQRDAERAHAATADPVWSVAARWPWGGQNLAAVAEVAAALDELSARGLPPLVEAAGIVDPGALAPVGGRLDLEPLRRAAPLLAEAADGFDAADATVRAVETAPLHDALAGPVRDAQDRLGRGARSVRAGAQALALLPPMLGADGPRTYLVLIQNNAELRATGGIPGALALLRADDGRLALTEQVAGSQVGGFAEPVLELPPGDEAVYSDRMGRYISDVTLTPHFPTAAGLAREMWRRRFGTPVDGVLATDPVALSYLMAATGPIEVGGGVRLAPGDVVDVLLSQTYARLDDTAAQDAFFAATAAAVFAVLTGGEVDGPALLDGLGRAAAERRLLVWSARPEEQERLEASGVGGVLPVEGGGATTAGVFLNDGTGAKMGYYLRSDVAVVDRRRTAAGREDTIRVRLTSTAPADAATSLPVSVTGPGTFGVPQGTVRTQVTVYGPVAGQVSGVLRDGRPAAGPTHDVRGRPVAVLSVDLRPRQSVTFDVKMAHGHETPVSDIWTTPTI